MAVDMSVNPENKVQGLCPKGRRLKGERKERELNLVSEITSLAPAAFGSVLYKMKSNRKEYVLSFQGTQFEDKAMLKYTLMKDPVALKWGGVSTITTEGFAMYVAQLFPCIESLASGVPIKWITGHSLGGAAATLYKATGGDGGLVTFGALPTVPRDPRTKPKGLYDLKTDGFVKADIPPIEISPIRGIRYFHKFDPVPGFYFSFGGWAHGVKTAFMMYDTIGECTEGYFPQDVQDGYTLPNYDPVYDSDYIGPIGELKSFLCSDYGVETNTEMVDKDLYSYTNAVQPFPCQEAITGFTLSTILADMDVTFAYWVPTEDVAACSATYLATVAAYGATYFSSALLGTVWSEPEFYLTFYAMWGLWWVHSAYPNYDMFTEWRP